MPRSKRYKELLTKIDKEQSYPIKEAVQLIKQTATTKFDSGIEVHLRLGINPKKGDQQIRGTVVLPHGIGKILKVAVFAEGDKAKEAKSAGADFVYNEEDIADIKKTGKIAFDIAVAQPEMMKKMAPIAKTLGQKGLMPSPKNETVTLNIEKTVKELKAGKIAYKNDDTANVHQLIGRASFEDKKIIDNFETIIKAIKESKPESLKATYIKNIYLTSSMGPSIKVEI